MKKKEDEIANLKQSYEEKYNSLLIDKKISESEDSKLENDYDFLIDNYTESDNKINDTMNQIKILENQIKDPKEIKKYSEADSTALELESIKNLLLKIAFEHIPRYSLNHNAQDSSINTIKIITKDLESFLIQCKNEISYLRNSYNDLDENLKSIENKFDLLKSQNKHLQSEKEEAERQIERCESDIIMYKNIIGTHNSSNEHDVKIDILYKNNTQMSQKLNEYSINIKKLEKEIESILVEKKKNLNEIEKLKKVFENNLIDKNYENEILVLRKLLQTEQLKNMRAFEVESGLSGDVARFNESFNKILEENDCLRKNLEGLAFA